jgi:hypothetical protein
MDLEQVHAAQFEHPDSPLKQFTGGFQFSTKFPPRLRKSPRRRIIHSMRETSVGFTLTHATATVLLFFAAAFCHNPSLNSASEFSWH